MSQAKKAHFKNYVLVIRPRADGSFLVAVTDTVGTVHHPQQAVWPSEGAAMKAACDLAAKLSGLRQDASDFECRNMVWVAAAIDELP